MAEQQELSRIERELVLQYLRDDNVPVTVTLEEKPQQQEADVAGGSVQQLQDDERVPASEVFPVAIPAEQMTVLEQGIILLKKPVRTIQPFLGRPVRVQFYFNRVGLYFSTTMKECSKGLALVVPSVIRRIPDVHATREYDVGAEVSYGDSAGKTVTVRCQALDRYPLFVLPSWGDIEPSAQKGAKQILERIIDDVKAGREPPVGNALHLFPVCRFLTEQQPEAMQAVQGRSEPCAVLYVDEAKLVLGTRDADCPLQKGFEYAVTLSFTLRDKAKFRRVMRIQAAYESQFRAAGSDATCMVLSFRAVKEEDVRFLYERLRGKKLTD